MTVRWVGGPVDGGKLDVNRGQTYLVMMFNRAAWLVATSSDDVAALTLPVEWLPNGDGIVHWPHASVIRDALR